MRAPAISKVMLGGFVAVLAVCGCGGRVSFVTGAAGSDGVGGAGLMGAEGGTVTAPSTSDTSGTGSGGKTGSTVAGSPGASGTIGIGSGGGSGASGGGGMAGAIAGGGAGGAVEPITKIVPSPGCGTAPAQVPGVAERGTIQTMGIKAPDCADKTLEGVPVCGPWSYLREYYVTLPLGYDGTKAYPLVFQGPGCGGNGSTVYPLNDPYPNGPANVGNTVIRVGLTPPPSEVGHATNPNQGCFDESEGDDSVEWPFYENLYDRLAGQLCFDKNRVFGTGTGSGGGRFIDELACKYAGDAKRPIRGVISNSGDWSAIPQYLPTCTTKPMAGMWVHEIYDPQRPWRSDELAIARAMMVDRCTIGTGYDDAKLADFPIGGGNPDATCKRIQGCPALTPLVVCLINGNQHTAHDSIVNPGASTFLKLFESPPLLSP